MYWGKKEDGEGRKGEATISPLTSHNIPNHRKKLLAGRKAQWYYQGGHVASMSRVIHEKLSEFLSLFGSFRGELAHFVRTPGWEKSLLE